MRATRYSPRPTQSPPDANGSGDVRSAGWITLKPVITLNGTIIYGKLNLSTPDKLYCGSSWDRLA